ncbi:hypothetical protein MD484_g5393, partial [Candolleomyces efflorescens]
MLTPFFPVLSDTSIARFASSNKASLAKLNFGGGVAVPDALPATDEAPFFLVGVPEGVAALEFAADTAANFCAANFAAFSFSFAAI